MRITKRARLGLVALIIVAIGAVAGIAGAASLTTAMNGGDTLTVSCAGSALSSSSVSATEMTLNCTPNTTPPPPPPPPPPPGTWWVPPQVAEWQWYLAGKVSNPPTNLQLGDGSKTYLGATAPNTTIIDVDGINNTAADVAELHSLGYHVICYMEVGTAGNYGGAYTTYYNELSAAGDLGNKLSGYPEKFININAPSAVSIVESIINDQCAGKGFDAVETDLDETFGGNEGNTGFTITQANEVSYLTTLSSYMHSLDLGWIAKDVDDTGSQSFVNSVEPMADAVITEQCQQYGTCSLLQPFVNAGKAVFDAEYTDEGGKSPSSFCPTANAENFNAVNFDGSLDGKTRTPCR